MLKNIIFALELMGQSMTEEQKEKTMDKIKDHFTSKEIDHLLFMADQYQSPIYEKLKKYRDNMGYSGYF